MHDVAKPPVAMTPALQELIERGAKLQREIAPLERKKAELDQIKASFRELAGDVSLELVTPSGAKVTVEPKPDTVCRVVEELKVARVIKLAGEKLLALFTLHPSKGSERNFELNAFKQLPKRSAETLIELLRAPATAWVKFSS